MRLNCGYRAMLSLALIICLIFTIPVTAAGETSDEAVGELFEGGGIFQGGSLEGPQRVDSSGTLRERRAVRESVPSRDELLYEDMKSAMSNCLMEPVRYNSQGVAYNGMGVCIELSGRGYTRSDADKTAVYMAYAQIVNGNPQWFYYVSDVVFFRIGDELSSVYLLVDMDMYGKRATYETEISAMLAEAIPDDTGMSEAEKALALHDYIALHLRYHYTAWNEYIFEHYGDSHWLYANYPGAFSAYGAIVDKHAVCHGMSLAYKDMLRRVGIEAYVEAAYSTGAGHAWNLVRIDGAWYHVDIMEDEAFRGSNDPDGDFDLLGYVSHDRFLVSDSEYPRRDTSLPPAPEDHPELGLWKDIDSGIYRAKSKWYYSAAAYSVTRRRSEGNLYELSPGGSPRLIASNASLPAFAGGKLYYYSYSERALRAYDPATESDGMVCSSSELPLVGEMGFGAIAPGGSEKAVERGILYMVGFGYPASQIRLLYLGDGPNGDVDRDGRSTVWDILAILRGAHGAYPLEPSQRAWADANGDLAVNEQDVRTVLDAILRN